MGPPRSSASKKSTIRSQQGRDGQRDKKKPPLGKPPSQQETDTDAENRIDLSATIPLPSQQLLLDVFKSALLTTDGQDRNARIDADAETQQPPASLDIKSLVQTIKSHLYNRDFDSAFTDASEDLLRAYALRWSASRALGYAGVFKSVLRTILAADDEAVPDPDTGTGAGTDQVVCIGGGAGAEIAALATVWRDLKSDPTFRPRRLAVTAVDIADWSGVVDRLTRGFRLSTSHSALLRPQEQPQDQSEDGDFGVGFTRADVLSLSDEELGGILCPSAGAGATVLVTLMFTLNELFLTSMVRTTEFLLRVTDLLRPGTVLLVVDSPGSYSTVSLRAAATTAVPERRYPMKFLLDHTLLSVAVGKWEKIYSQDSRWWRRDAARLRYYVGEGVGLEDMRFQVHIYRRLDED